VIFGITWASIESGTRWMSGTRVTFSMLTWFLFLVMMFLRATAGWRGRKAAVMALSVMACSVLTWITHVTNGRILIPVKLLLAGLNHKRLRWRCGSGSRSRRRRYPRRWTG